MNDPLVALEQWAAPLLLKLEPGQRRRLTRTVAVELRRSQQRRIAAQQNPDGSPYAPRKRELRSKAGRVKRNAMFVRLRQAKHLRLISTANEASVGFVGRVARIARIHQEGQSDVVNRSGLRVRYERRELLGFTAADRERIRDLLIEHLTR